MPSVSVRLKLSKSNLEIDSESSSLLSASFCFPSSVYSNELSGSSNFFKGKATHEFDDWVSPVSWVISTKLFMDLLLRVEFRRLKRIFENVVGGGMQGAAFRVTNFFKKLWSYFMLSTVISTMSSNFEKLFIWQYVKQQSESEKPKCLTALKRKLTFKGRLMLKSTILYVFKSIIESQIILGSAFTRVHMTMQFDLH